MYCKNCGNAMDDKASVCVKCGCQKGVGNSYCSNCGAAMNPGANVCLSCGAAQNTAAQGQGKSRLLAGLMGIFFGAFGVHNFILGNTGKAVAQLLITVLSCGILGAASAIWGLVEGIMILAGSINTDANGVPLT